MLPITIGGRRVISSAARVVNKPQRFYSQQKETISLQNIETRWKTMAPAERSALTKQLEEAQLGDWKALSVEEKRAAYYVAFGSHGAREPVTKPGHVPKLIASVLGIVAISSAMMYVARAKGQESPHTMEPEWREKTNEYLREQKSNPISGISSEGYKGKGF
ncbi:cytochrome c oxidase subunit IV [Circinella umbellata]|nr:cytochrome c oxidase subunit IV [Circinella umbellata]